MWTVDEGGNVISKINGEQMNQTVDVKYPKPMFVFTTSSPFLEAEKLVRKCCRGFNLYAEEGYGFVVVGKASPTVWKRAVSTVKNHLKDVKIIKENY